MPLESPVGFLRRPSYIWGVVPLLPEDTVCDSSSLPVVATEVDGVAVGWPLDDDVGGRSDLSCIDVPQHPNKLAHDIDKLSMDAAAA